MPVVPKSPGFIRAGADCLLPAVAVSIAGPRRRRGLTGATSVHTFI
jgi:hypothetical protein